MPNKLNILIAGFISGVFIQSGNIFYANHIHDIGAPTAAYMILGISGGFLGIALAFSFEFVQSHITRVKRLPTALMFYNMVTISIMLITTNEPLTCIGVTERVISSLLWAGLYFFILKHISPKKNPAES